MCDLYGGADVDFGADSDIGDSSVDRFDVADDIETSNFESMSDVEAVSDASETVESLQDVEESFESGDIDEAEAYPELSEFDDIDDQSILVADLEDKGNQLENVELQEEMIGASDTISLPELDDAKPEMTFTQEELQELYEEHAEDPEFGDKMGELILSGRVAILDMEDIDESGEEGVKVLTREITPEILEGREQDTEEVLGNYRENLQERGVSEEQIEAFIDHERERINAEYESLDAGKPSESIYQMPTDWDAVAEDLNGLDGTPFVENEGINTDSEVDSEIEDISNSGVELEENVDDLATEETDQGIDRYISLSEMEDIDSETFDVNEESEISSDIDEMDSNIEDVNEGNNSEDLNEEGIIEEILEDNGLIDESDVINEDLDESLVVGESLNEMDDDTDQVEDISYSIQDMPVENIDETQEIAIDYDEIYEGITQESLEQGFEDVDIYEDAERLDASLENFEASNWGNLSIDDQKQSMNDLAEYVEEVIGFDNPPRIEYYNNPREGDYGGYNSQTNTLSINEYMLYNNSEAADTVAHELWHAHQHECAAHPSSARDYQYQYNFENYIRPEMGHEAYENQLIEAEARAFAAQFKGRLVEIGSRRR